jgi:hypothetical protein
MVAVPSVFSTNASQSGIVPVRVSDAVGKAEVRTVKVPSTPAVKVVLAALVMVGARKIGTASCTVRVKSCVAFGSVPFFAVSVIL